MYVIDESLYELDIIHLGRQSSFQEESKEIPKK